MFESTAESVETSNNDLDFKVSFNFFKTSSVYEYISGACNFSKSISPSSSKRFGKVFENIS